MTSRAKYRKLAEESQARVESARANGSSPEVIAYLEAAVKEWQRKADAPVRWGQVFVPCGACGKKGAHRKSIDGYRKADGTWRPGYYIIECRNCGKGEIWDPQTKPGDEWMTIPAAWTPKEN